MHLRFTLDVSGGLEEGRCSVCHYTNNNPLRCRPELWPLFWSIWSDETSRCFAEESAPGLNYTETRRQSRSRTNASVTPRLCVIESWSAFWGQKGSELGGMRRQDVSAALGNAVVKLCFTTAISPFLSSFYNEQSSCRSGSGVCEFWS